MIVHHYNGPIKVHSVLPSSGTHSLFLGRWKISQNIPSSMTTSPTTSSSSPPLYSRLAPWMFTHTCMQQSSERKMIELASGSHDNASLMYHVFFFCLLLTENPFPSPYLQPTANQAISCLFLYTCDCGMWMFPRVCVSKECINLHWHMHWAKKTF